MGNPSPCPPPRQWPHGKPAPQAQRNRHLDKFFISLHSDFCRVPFLGGLLGSLPTFAQQLFLFCAHFLYQVVCDILQDGVLGREALEGGGKRQQSSKRKWLPQTREACRPPSLKCGESTCCLSDEVPTRRREWRRSLRRAKPLSPRRLCPACAPILN